MYKLLNFVNECESFKFTYFIIINRKKNNLEA